MNDIGKQRRIAPAADEGGTGPTILQVLPALAEGGAERGALDLTRHLVDHGWRALIASNGGPGEATVHAYGGDHVRFPLHSKNPFTIRANLRRLQRLIREREVRLVHARSRAPAWSAFYAARRCDVPFVTTFHGVYRGADGILKRYYNRIMARGDRVIAISDYLADHIRQWYDVPEERLRVVHRGVDVDQFDPAAVSAERIRTLAERWRVRLDDKVIMLPGRVVRRKGHRLLLRALERLPRRNFVCLMVGGFEANSSYVREIEGNIASLGLTNVVRMVGSCADMPAGLMLADVVVVPSTGAPEPFGRVSVEAQAMGKPVIVTDCGGLSETLMPAATGWLVAPDEPDELAQAIGLAIALPDDVASRLAARARRFVLRTYTVEQMVSGTMAVYRELLEGHSPHVDAEILSHAA